MILRDYQQSILDYINRNPNRDICVQSPTGTGKGVVIKAVVDQFARQNRKTLIIVPSKELCLNLSDRIPNSVVANSDTKPDLKSLSQSNCLIVTYKSANKYRQIYKPFLIISDEAHLCMANTWTNEIKQYKKLYGCQHIGFTATPNRLDGKPLSIHFDLLYESQQISWFIQNGYLADYELEILDCPLFKSTTNTDDLQLQELTFIPQIDSAISLWNLKASDRKSIVFVPTIKYGEILEAKFREHSINASFVSSKTCTHERDRVFNDFKNGSLNVLINVQLFQLGVDIPDCDCVILLRFTYSTALFLQMIGRCLRPKNKKALIMDLTGNCYYHGQPKDSFYWSLDGQKSRAISNYDSITGKCPVCETRLFQKQFLRDISSVCCLNCRTESIHVPENLTKISERSRIERELEVNTVRLTDHTITQLTRILYNKKISQQNKIKKILTLDIDIDVIRKALEYLKVPKDHIDFYLE